MIRIKIDKAEARELANCEEGRWEDWSVDPDPMGKPWAYLVADQAAHVGVLVCETPAEVCDLYFAVCSGTFKMYHHATACRIADALREEARKHEPQTVELWDKPDPELQR